MWPRLCRRRLPLECDRSTAAAVALQNDCRDQFFPCRGPDGNNVLSGPDDAELAYLALAIASGTILLARTALSDKAAMPNVRRLDVTDKQSQLALAKL